METTGLSGGTGTYAFLIGVGTFDNLSFRVRQFFLTDPSAERAMLAALAETLERCQCIVSFNGKSFDVPQLATRFALSRLDDPFAGLVHVDLLHPARRLYSHLLPSSRLAEIERHLMGVRRYGDISGSLIPAMYFSYIRRRNVRGLPPIFEHNSLDVLSLAGLIGYLNETWVAEETQDAALLLALGRWNEARGGEAEARYVAARQASDGPASAEATWRLCRLLKRRGEWRECIALWETEAESEDAARKIRALIELSKLAEHRMKDPPQALIFAQAAQQCIDLSRYPARFVETQAALARRLSRLKARAAKDRIVVSD
ncbi:MAG: ribonuclease H-like domain-containing protein [Vicinamibacterales bacterium]